MGIIFTLALMSAILPCYMTLYSMLDRGLGPVKAILCISLKENYETSLVPIGGAVGYAYIGIRIFLLFFIRRNLIPIKARESCHGSIKFWESCHYS